MEIKLSAKTVGYALCAALLLGMLIGSALTWKCGRREVISTIDTLMVREFKHDTTCVYDTIILSKTDTFYIEPTTPIGQIPVVMKLVQDSLPLDVYGKRIWIPYNLGMYYRGILYSYYVATKPKPFEITVKTPWVDPFLMVGFYVNYLKQVSSEVSGGFVFFDHYALTGKAELDCDMKSNLKLGVGWVF